MHNFISLISYSLYSLVPFKVTSSFCCIILRPRMPFFFNTFQCVSCHSLGFGFASFFLFFWGGGIYFGTYFTTLSPYFCEKNIVNVHPFKFIFPINIFPLFSKRYKVTVTVFDFWFPCTVLPERAYKVKLYKHMITNI